jgi:hypothetical protein
MDYTQQLQKRREETKGMRPAVERGLKAYRLTHAFGVPGIDAKRTANLKIQDAYNEIARGKPISPESQYEEEFKQLIKRKPIMPGYATPETGAEYKSNLKLWDEELSNLQKKYMVHSSQLPNRQQ